MATLRLNKVVEGRGKWRGRATGYQVEKRALQDRNRYLEKVLLKKEAQLSQADKEIGELKKMLR